LFVWSVLFGLEVDEYWYVVIEYFGFECLVVYCGYGVGYDLFFLVIGFGYVGYDFVYCGVGF